MSEAYNIANKCDICISESYLDSTVPLDDNFLNDYNLTYADHPDNVKKRGVCIYYKKRFLFWSMCIMWSDLPEWERLYCCYFIAHHQCVSQKMKSEFFSKLGNWTKHYIVFTRCFSLFFFFLIQHCKYKIILFFIGPLQQFF